MLKSYRRFWILIAACALSAPLVVGFVSPDRAGTSSTEQRALAPLPSAPRTLAQWSAFPPQVNAYLTDHFGLRQTLIRLDAVIRHYYLDSGNDQVLIGQDDSLIYRGNRLLQSSAGIDIRHDRITATADLLATVHTMLTARGIKFVVAPPPNSATVYPEKLPSWMRPDGRKTEYDLLISALAQRNVPTVDLRAPLFAAKPTGNLFWRYDTHWTPLGSLVGFNALVIAIGLADWQIDPAAVLIPVVEYSEGDLARMLDLTGWLRESEHIPAAPDLASFRKLTPQQFPPFVVVSKHAGPTVLIIGDSFTEDKFIPFVIRGAGRYVWIHHEFCGFDWKWIDEFHPDFVWYMPTERVMLCEPGESPRGMPTVASAIIPAPLGSTSANVSEH